MKSKKIKTLKLIIVSIISCFVFVNVRAQETITNETQADKDWKALNFAMSDLGTSEDYNAAIKAGIVEMRKYYDIYRKKRSQLAKFFWENYPEDPRQDKALFYFFHINAEPYFIPEMVSDSLTNLLVSIPYSDKSIGRLTPVDDDVMEQWRQVGDDMVTSVLNSKMSLEHKEAVAFQLISREFRLAIKLVNPLTKKKIEIDYWNRFEIQYWQHIRLLLEQHVNKYAELDIVAGRVQNILTLLKNFSSAASDEYWKYFFETSSSDNQQAVQTGIKALHKLAKENVAAIEVLKVIDYSKPLEMVFTAMDGSKVDLATLRGKVVLIDFWATYCGPCIKEMPHVKAMYDKYRDQGFEVIGITADGDANKQRVLSIFKESGANWPQRLDQGSDAFVSYHSLYEIKVLPTVWLLNKEGVIVDRNARGERLEPLIRKYLGL